MECKRHIFLWAKLPRCVVKWPVMLVGKHNKNTVRVFCNSDDAEFLVSTKNISPFSGPNVKAYKEAGVVLLQRKNLKATLESFCEDVGWACKGASPCADSSENDSLCAIAKALDSIPVDDAQSVKEHDSHSMDVLDTKMSEPNGGTPCVDSSENDSLCAIAKALDSNPVDDAQSVKEHDSHSMDVLDTKMSEPNGGTPCVDSSENDSLCEIAKALDSNPVDDAQSVKEHDSHSMDVLDTKMSEPNGGSPCADSSGNDSLCAKALDSNPDDDLQCMAEFDRTSDLDVLDSQPDENDDSQYMALDSNPDVDARDSQYTNDMEHVSDIDETDDSQCMALDSNPDVDARDSQYTNDMEHVSDIDETDDSQCMALDSNPDVDARDSQYTNDMEHVSDSDDSIIYPVSEQWPQLSNTSSLEEGQETVKKSKHVTDDMSDLSDDDVNEDEILRDSKNPAIFIRKVMKQDVTKTGKSKKSSRVYNSYHFCTFCNRLFSNFSQHMRRNHMDKEPVKRTFQIADADARKRQILLLSAEMDHTNNVQNQKRGKWEILLFRRPSTIYDHTSFGPCPKCLLWISKKMMKRHQSVCVAGGRLESSAALLTQSDIISERIASTASMALVNEVFKYMHNDEVGKLARQYQLIISLGNMWMEKNVGHKLKRGKYTSQIMRLVARLLLNIRLTTKTDLNFCEYLKPCYFDHIGKATLMTAGLGVEEEEYLKNPSNAVKLGHDIKRLLNIKIGLAILKKDKLSRDEAEDFLRTMNIFWGTRITKLGKTLLAERQFNKRVILPEATDIQKLNEYLNARLSTIDTESTTLENYNYIAKLLCVKLVQYNRRRPAEIEDIQIKDYDRRVCGANQSTIIGNLSRFEKKLLESQEVLEVRGKGHKGVPVIIPEVAKNGLRFVANNAVRQKVGINMQSPYLFATTGETRDVFRVYDAVVHNCRRAELQYPERITCTNLRKYMATITQVLDLKPHQLEWVLKHMGHSLDVHKIYYRATSDVIERTQIAKILLLQDSGRIDEFSNQSLEDIQLSDLADPEAGQDGIEPDDLTELLNESETMQEVEKDTFDNIETAVRNTNRSSVYSSNAKQKWTTQEEEEIKQLFSKYFETKTRPTPTQCLKAINISKKRGGTLASRKKNILKKKVFRMIDRLKK